MLVLAPATSYAASTFREASEWPKIHRWFIGNAPRPPELALVTAGGAEPHLRRIRTPCSRAGESESHARQR